MTILSALHRLLPGLLPALLLAATLPPALGQAEAEGEKIDLSEQRDVLEKDLIRLYTLIAQDAEPATKTTLLGHHRELTSRANRLLDKFDPGKYEELRYDINIQCQRLARKQAPLAMLPNVPEPDTIPAFVLEDIHPSPSNPAEVRAALDIVDLTIRRMESRLFMLPAFQQRTEQARIQRLKERRAALRQDFTQERWDALVAETK